MLKRFLFVFLLLGFVISVPYELNAAPVNNKPNLLPKYKKIFQSYGIELVVENYITAGNGKILTQDDLNADIERILHQFNRMGRKYVEMSKCRKIVIRGSHPKVAFARGNSLHFKYRTTGAIRHELFHSFDLSVRFCRFFDLEPFGQGIGGAGALDGGKPRHDRAKNRRCERERGKIFLSLSHREHGGGGSISGEIGRFNALRDDPKYAYCAGRRTPRHAQGADHRGGDLDGVLLFEHGLRGIARPLDFLVSFQHGTADRRLSAEGGECGTKVSSRVSALAASDLYRGVSRSFDCG